MSKEEILGSSGAIYVSETEFTGIKKDILNAMDEYAKQECDMFSFWLMNNYYRMDTRNGLWTQPHDDDSPELEFEDLYKLYQNKEP